jgi:hypothetical protein
VISLGLEGEDYADIATNLLACSANQFDQIERVDKIVSSFNVPKGQCGYEFQFNQS